MEAMSSGSGRFARSVGPALACLALLASAAHTSAAPHLTGAKPEPPIHGRLGGRLRRAPARVGSSSTALTLRDDSVRILLLKVDFPPDDDASTTGTGEWGEPRSPRGGDPDDEVADDASRFVAYYDEVSYGHLAVEVVAMPSSPGAYRLPRPMARYGSESDRDIQDLVYDAVTAAAGDQADPVTDFTLFDAVVVVHAGAGEESDVAGDSGGDIWSLYYETESGDAFRSSATGLALAQRLRDGRPIHEAIVVPQTDSQDGVAVDPLGVWAHEFGHWLGLPDLYCTSDACLPDGVGKWSLMGDGIYNRVGDAPFGSSPAQLDAWSKVLLGWVTPVEARSPDPGAVRMPPVEGEPIVYRLPASSDPAAGAQYFLVENRQQVGWDAGLPGHGLLVWLVDDSVIGDTDCAVGSTSRFCQNAIEVSPLRPGVKLVEADGDEALQKHGCGGAGIDCGSAGDPFPGTSGATRFTPDTVPSSSGYTSPPWVNLRDVSEDETTGEVSLSIGFGPHPPEDVAVDARGNVSWRALATEDDPDPAVLFNVYRQGVLATLAPVSLGGYRDPAPAAGALYQVTAIDAAGNVSAPSGPAVWLPGGGSSASDSRCFIATAAYGSYLDPHVKALRAFRDRHLLTNRPGRALVDLYYRWSPPVAQLISTRDAARCATRWALTPLVLAVEHPDAAWAAAGGAGLLALVLRRARRRAARQPPSSLGGRSGLVAGWRGRPRAGLPHPSPTGTATRGLSSSGGSGR
jgi:M6 family metalloprotease-like protein